MADWPPMPYKYENATPNFTLFNHCPPNRRSPCEFGHRRQKKKNIPKKCAQDIIHQRLPRAHLMQLKSLRPKFNSVWMIIIWAHRTDIPGGGGNHLYPHSHFILSMRSMIPHSKRQNFSKKTSPIRMRWRPAKFQNPRKREKREILPEKVMTNSLISWPASVMIEKKVFHENGFKKGLAEVKLKEKQKQLASLNRQIKFSF